MKFSKLSFLVAGILLGASSLILSSCGGSAAVSDPSVLTGTAAEAGCIDPNIQGYDAGAGSVSEKKKSHKQVDTDRKVEDLGDCILLDPENK